MALNGLKIDSHYLKMPDIGLKGPTKVFKLKSNIYFKNENSDLKNSTTHQIENLILYHF